MTDAAFLERLNYEALVPAAAITNGVELVIREDVIMTRSEQFPAPDSTHACLLRAAPENAEPLLDEVIAYFLDKRLTPTIYLSPSCTPADWPDRLLNRGFIELEDQESWMILDRLEDFQFQPFNQEVTLLRVSPENVLAFAETFLSAFEQPVEIAPMLAELLQPSTTLPDTFHYLAQLDGENAGTVSLIRCRNYGIIGSGGIVPAHRRSKIIAALFHAAYVQAQQQGISSIFGQTQAGSYMEHLLGSNNFRRAFVRRCFMLG
ncbi:MAG: GNAT family N-acetyltransferase [Anaerolineae bacterium]|nr:GNAT family N-acetyltransferase [Anaerolineae bacterium]